MNYARIPGPGDLAGPPDDDFSEDRWETSIEKRTDWLCDDGAAVQQMVEAMATGGAWLALHRVLRGDALHPGDRAELERLQTLCYRENSAVNKLYDTREDYA